MKKLVFVSILSLIFFSCNQSKGQQNTNKKREDIQYSCDCVDKAVGLLNELYDLIGAKTLDELKQNNQYNNLNSLYENLMQTCDGKIKNWKELCPYAQKIVATFNEIQEQIQNNETSRSKKETPSMTIIPY